MNYDTKALELKDWQEQKEDLLAEGWEVLKEEPRPMPAGCAAIYLRRPFEEKQDA